MKCGEIDEIFLNSLLSDKFLDWTKLKAFADNKLDTGVIVISVFHRIENTVGKGKNAGYQHFSFTQSVF